MVTARLVMVSPRSDFAEELCYQSILPTPPGATKEKTSRQVVLAEATSPTHHASLSPTLPHVPDCPNTRLPTSPNPSPKKSTHGPGVRLFKIRGNHESHESRSCDHGFHRFHGYYGLGRYSIRLGFGSCSTWYSAMPQVVKGEQRRESSW